MITDEGKANFALATSLAVARASASQENYNDHLIGDALEFLALMRDFVAVERDKVIDEMERRGIDPTTEDSRMKIGVQMSTIAFMAGRAYEEITLSALAREGGLDSLCTKCKGKEKQ